MIRRPTVLLALAAFACAGTSAAQPARPSVIANPDWMQRPSAEDLADHYPEIATYIDMDGRATMSCTVSTLGQLQDCSVVSEDPPDLGFGRAVLEMAGLFRMRPMTVNGQPVAGGTVRIPIRFVLPEAEATGPLPKAPSARSRATALKIMDTVKVTETFEREYEDAARAIEFTIDDPVPDAVRSAAADALRSAVKARLPELKQAYADAYAAHFTQAELDGILAFHQGPAASVLTPDADVLALQEMIGREFVRQLMIEGRAEFCRGRPCELAVATDGPPDSIEAPVWVEEPSRAALMRATPPLANMLGIGGYVRLSCQATAQGLLQQCRVVADSPPGFGFGQASLSLAAGFRLAPALVAQASGGKTVAVRMTFPSGDPPPVWDAPEPRSPRALQLAKQIMEAGPQLANFEALMTAGFIERMGAPAPGADPATTDAAMAALRIAGTRALQHYVDQSAATLASRFTEEQLAAAVAFRTSPAGQAQMRKEVELGESFVAVATAYGRLIAKDARANYCKARPCPAATPAR